MKSLFVTGTDTDIGKTCVTASIVKNLRDRDIDVGVMKPFASGYKKNSNSISEDVEILMKYSGSHDPVDLVNPYFFEIPTSPYDACKILAQKINLKKVIDAYHKLLSSHDLLIVEGNTKEDNVNFLKAGCIPQSENFSKHIRLLDPEFEIDVVESFGDVEPVMDIVNFIRSGADTSRAICRPKLDRAA